MFTDAFVLYRPRDIVSGDFYWAHTAPDGKKLIAVGDCTGHGVPGAMMSMLGTAFLDDIVVESGETNPGKILNKLRDAVKKAMSKGAGRDGMDMSLCVLDGQRLYFAGANLPLYILRQKEIIELKGDKQPLGHQPAGEKPFGTQTMELNKGDRIYLFSDGFADQFGGPRGKKFKYSALREKLCRSGEQSAKLQMNYLEAELNAWKGDLEQVDDICVVGIHA
jgi:serine phosphatase RsbU (regulator of sigma subunit)